MTGDRLADVVAHPSVTGPTGRSGGVGGGPERVGIERGNGIPCTVAGGGQGANGHGCVPEPGSACVAELRAPRDTVAAMRAALAVEPEPLVTLTHLLRLCRDEHPVLWEGVDDPRCRTRVSCLLAELSAVLPAPGTAAVVGPDVRAALAGALAPLGGTPAVVIARALAELVDAHYGHTFAASFSRRSPYQPRVGDPVPLGGVDLRAMTVLSATSPPWRLANRLDETRRVRLAGEWAAQFRIVFDYCLADALVGLVSADTVVATCHPNRSLEEFVLPEDARQRSFPVRPARPLRQREEINDLIGAAVAAGASIVVLPELSVIESLATELGDWVRRPDGLRLLVAGSYHHETDVAVDGVARSGRRRRNTAVAWVRGADRPLTHDKHSPADRPVLEDIQPQGWPELRIYVSADGWHLVIAICRDLLNPNAVHALTEAGANLILVPAMSETLVPFGGPVAQLVSCDQAFVVVANNPAHWSRPGQPVTRQAARALFGHPGFEHQTRFVHAADSTPGVARLQVRSGEVIWLPMRPAHIADQITNRDVTHHNDRAGSVDATPTWVSQLAARTGGRPDDEAAPETVTLRSAAVLVLLTDAPAGPRVLLTQRAPDLVDYPAQLVFPGGTVQTSDRGPVDTALREAHEEVGLDPTSVQIIGLLAPYVLTDTGFLVTPVVAWSAHPGFPDSANPAEVSAVVDVPLHNRDGAPRSSSQPGAGTGPRTSLVSSYGPMTATVLDLLTSMLSSD